MSISYNFSLEFNFDIPTESRTAMIEELKTKGIEESSITSLEMMIAVKVSPNQSNIVRHWIKRHKGEQVVI